MDKYDIAIEYLTEHPEEISHAWDQAAYDDVEGSCLFQFANKTNEDTLLSENTRCGCLTQIKLVSIGTMKYVAETLELTRAIREDDRLPSDPEDIKVADLPVFAEWQRRIDKELNRV